MKTSRLVVESSASCTSLTRQSSFNVTPLTALRFHSKHTQTLRFRLRRQSAPRLRGKNWTYVAASCRRASKKKKKTPQTANIHLPPSRELARAQCQHKRYKSSRPQFSLILLRLRRNEDCFPKRQTSFVISSSFFFFLCVRNSKLSSKMASQGWNNVTWC